MPETWIYGKPEWGLSFDQELYKFCEETFKNAAKLVKPNGQNKNGDPGNDYHATLLNYSHPFTDEDREWMEDVGVEDQVFQGTFTDFLPLYDQGLVILRFECRPMAEFFDLVYTHFKKHAMVPEHTKFRNYYKGFSPHITVAKYNSEEELREEFDSLDKEVVNFWKGRPIRINNFTVVDNFKNVPYPKRDEDDDDEVFHVRLSKKLWEWAETADDDEEEQKVFINSVRDTDNVAETRERYSTRDSIVSGRKSLIAQKYISNIHKLMMPPFKQEKSKGKTKRVSFAD